MQHIDRRSYAWQSKKAIVLDCNNQSCHNNHQLTRLIHEIFNDRKRQQVRFCRLLSPTIRYKWSKKTASESMSNISKKHQKHMKLLTQTWCLAFNITKHLKFQYRTSCILPTRSYSFIGIGYWLLSGRVTESYFPYQWRPIAHRSDAKRQYFI